MVKFLSNNDRDAIEQALAQAKQRTSSNIVVTVMHSSDNYLDFILLYGLLLSDFLMLGLWMSRISTHFLELLAVQIGLLLSLFFIPILHRLCWRFVPVRILHQRSARRALEEYHLIHRKLPATAPLVLLFVSLGERYTHILSSRAVHDKIPDTQWESVVHDFGKRMRSTGLAEACSSAVHHISDLLTPHFPENGELYASGNQIIEREI